MCPGGFKFCISSACLLLPSLQVCITQKYIQYGVDATTANRNENDAKISETNAILEAQTLIKRPKRNVACQGDGEDSDDQENPNDGQPVSKVSMMIAPLPLPLHGILVSSPLYATAMKLATIQQAMKPVSDQRKLPPGGIIRSGRDFLIAESKAATHVDRQEHSLFVVIYQVMGSVLCNVRSTHTFFYLQARGLLVPPHVLLCHAHARRDRLAAAEQSQGIFSDDGPVDSRSVGLKEWLVPEHPSLGIGPKVPTGDPSQRPPGHFLRDTRHREELRQGLVVRVSSAVTSSHESPSSLEVGPAPLWYHALALSHRPLLPKGGVPGSLPLGLKFSVLLDGKVIAQTEDGSLALSPSPRWVPLTSESDASSDAGALLVMCTYDASILDQVRLLHAAHGHEASKVFSFFPSVACVYSA